MKKNKFLIVDDHPVFRLGLKNVISTQYNDIVDILEASNGKQALAILNDQRVDCLILDINMPVMNGLTLISRLRKMRMPVMVIVLSSHREPCLVYNLLRMGVHGYISKNHSIENIKTVIETVLDGHLSYPVEYDRTFKDLIQSGNIPAIQISQKEKQILDLVAQGMTGVEIADVTGYTKRTVETKKCRLEKRFCAKNSPALVHLAHRLGILV